MNIFTDLLEKAFPFALDGLYALADSKVKGAGMSLNEKRLVYEGYVVLNLHARNLAFSTENKYDDATIDRLIEFCADCLTEAEIAIPEIPEELLDIELAEEPA